MVTARMYSPGFTFSITNSPLSLQICPLNNSFVDEFNKVAVANSMGLFFVSVTRPLTIADGSAKSAVDISIKQMDSHVRLKWK